MDIISLASGAGLWDWSRRELGNNIKVQCEKDKTNLCILNQVFPESIKYNDILDINLDNLNNIKFYDSTFVVSFCNKKFSLINPKRLNNDLLDEEYNDPIYDRLIFLTDKYKPRFVVVESVMGFTHHYQGLRRLVYEFKKKYNINHYLFVFLQ